MDYPKFIVSNQKEKSISIQSVKCNILFFKLIIYGPADETLELITSIGNSGHPEDHFCEIILNMDHWFKRRCHFKISR